MDRKPPVFNLTSLNSRMENLIRCFEDLFSCKAHFIIRAPGRVNLIGEHIDYSGYSVFPMGIKNDMLLAISPREDEKLILKNLSKEYEDFSCFINDFEISSTEHHWYNYFLCGIKGIANDCTKDFKGLSVLITGSIPPSAGLSSSSALVCGAALAMSHIHNLDYSLKELAEICANSERYVGTLGGGMDQAAILLSTGGYAQMIEFNPLKCTPVCLPNGAKFVIANSLCQKNKASSSSYNHRVVECRLACCILALKLNLDVKCTNFGELQKLSQKGLDEMITFAKSALHPESYTKEELCEILNLSKCDLDKTLLSENTKHLSEFNLYKRAIHVFSEAKRVLDFKDICLTWSSSLKTEETTLNSLKELGHLMNASHSSLRDLYECSHPSLDRMTEFSTKYSLGSRLTGAGWGGCIVALVLEEHLSDYIDYLTKNYYMNEQHGNENLQDAIFSTEPSEGACIYGL